MKTLLFQFLIAFSFIYSASANHESGLLSSMEKEAFVMKVYQRQGNMVAVHLQNKTNTDKVLIKISDEKGNLLHAEKISGSKFYVKKFDFSAVKDAAFKIWVAHDSETYQSEVKLKKITPVIEIHQRLQNVVAVHTDQSYGKLVSIYISNAITGEEITTKQLKSASQSVSKFDFSKVDIAKVNVKVVVGSKMKSELITLK